MIHIIDKNTFDKIRYEYYGFDKSYIDGKIYRYDSLDEIKKTKVDGKFSINVSGYQFDGFYHYGGEKFLYVVFCGARTSGGAMAPIPQYPRWSYYSIIEKLGGSFLCFSDPMFVKYPTLKLGWFYGDEKVSGIAESLKIVEAISKRDHIDEQNIYFYGSSGGGYASLYAASLWPGSLAVAINPQLFIQDYIHTNHFIETTGIDLHRLDPLKRNDLLKQIQTHDYSKYLILFNVCSTYDMKQYAYPLISYFDLKLDSIIADKENLGLWLYECAGAPEPHTSFETKSIFYFIYFIANRFKSGDSLYKFKEAILFTTEQWHDIFDLKNKLYQSEKKLKVSKACSYQSFLRYVTGRVDVKNIGFCNNKIEVLDTSCGYSSPHWFDDNQGQGLVFQSTEGVMHLKLKMMGNGYLKIWLRGIADFDVHGTRKLVWITYSDFSINREKILNHERFVCHDSPYVWQKKVVDGEIVEIYACWHPFMGEN